MSEPTCWTLIRAAAEGSEADREEFGRRYLPVVRRILAARWRGTPLEGELEDAVQEVFVACFREGGALQRAVRIEHGFGAFLFGVTRNIALRMERAGARRSRRFRAESQPEAVSWDSGLARTFDREYARTLVQEAMDTLAARAKLLGGGSETRLELLRQRFEEGRPVRDIARLWDVDARELHLEEAKAAREFRSAFRQVVGLSERCAPEHTDRECARLLELLE